MKAIAADARLAAVLTTFCLSPLAAQPAVPPAPLSGTQLAGQGTLRFLSFEVYHARLWVSPGFQPGDYAAQPVPLAQALDYRRDFGAEAIAQRSIGEMRRAGPFSAQEAERWQQALQAALPDVKAGDRLVGLHRPGVGVAFQLDGRIVGEVADPYFSRLFFGIWLSPQTSEPQLRQALIAGRNTGRP